MNLRYLLFLVAILGFFSKSNAQYYKDGKFLIGASVGYQYPLGDFGKQAKAGPSFKAIGQMMLNKKIGVGAELGYSTLGQDDFWNGSHLGNYDVNYSILSAQLKGSFYFDTWDRDFRPYATLAFGYFLYRNEIGFISTSSGSVNQKRTIKENKVGLTPIVGFLYHLSDQWSFDMNLRYTYIPDFPQTVDAKNELGETYQYYLGFDKISLPELSIGLFYRF
ncbi:MAG: porin family protein [Labilibaculum sp.]|nr:outer membrane beta-barrel protein [Labilibaculum sp.]MBI9056907.1 porin family protein [Labilibaculum sp.]